MPSSTPVIRPEAETAHERETEKPAVWTPKDAADFLTSALREAQQPLADALRRPSVPPSLAIWVVIVLGIAAAAAWLNTRWTVELLEKDREEAQNAAIAAREDKNQADAARFQAQGQEERYRHEIEALKLRLAAYQEAGAQQDQTLALARQQLAESQQAAEAQRIQAEAQLNETRQALAAANEALQQQQAKADEREAAAGQARAAADETKRRLAVTETEKAKAEALLKRQSEETDTLRKQADLLRQQLSGAEMEKMALNRQLAAAHELARLSASNGDSAPAPTPAPEPAPESAPAEPAPAPPADAASPPTETPAS